MIKVFCNRCEKEIVRGRTKINLVVQSATVLHSGALSSDETIHRWHDLCDDCWGVIRSVIHRSIDEGKARAAATHDTAHVNQAALNNLRGI